MSELSHCVICGSRRVSRGKVTVRRRNGAVVTVDADVCAACGEQYFDPQAMRQIESARPERRRRPPD